MTTAEKNRMISFAILSHLEAGKPLPAAIDAVFGAGAHAAIAGMIWEIMRAADAKAAREKST